MRLTVFNRHRTLTWGERGGGGEEGKTREAWDQEGAVVLRGFGRRSVKLPMVHRILPDPLATRRAYGGGQAVVWGHGRGPGFPPFTLLP